MVDYADIDAVKDSFLGIDDDAEDARLADLNAVVSRQMEARAGLTAGESFGVDGEDVTRTFIPPAWTEVLPLIPPLRVATTVTVDGADLTADTDYALVWRKGGLAYGLYRMGDPFGWAAVNRDPVVPLGWSGTIVVTGRWADQGVEPIDPVITEAANVLVAGYWRKDQTANGEVGGPDGQQITQGDPWSDPRVVRFLDTYASWQKP